MWDRRYCEGKSRQLSFYKVRAAEAKHPAFHQLRPSEERYYVLV